MAAEPIKGLGEGGLNADQPSINLPPNVFSDVSNVRFDDGTVQTINGETTYVVATNTPEYGIHWRRPDAGYNIFANDGVINRVDAAGNVSAMLNSVDAKYTNSDWQGTLFNGGFAIVINNNTSTPLYCLYNDATADHTFTELPNWNYVTGLTVFAKVVRSLNYSLIAANLTLNNSGTITYAPGTIRVSVQASTGAIPQVWEPGVTTDTADEFELSSTSPILDMLELRNNMFVYSQDSISLVSIGATTRVQPYSKTYGILNTDCVVEFDGQHLVVDKNDIYMHNGSGAIESVADFRIKKYFFSNLNKTLTNLVHMVRDTFHKEIWICYPKGAATTCTEALIYQYKNKTWTKRTLPSITYSFKGAPVVSNAFSYVKEVIYMTTATTQTLVTDDGYLMWNGSALAAFTSYVEKLKINAGDVSGSSRVDGLFPLFDNCDPAALVTMIVSGQNNYATNADLTTDTDRTTFALKPADLAVGYKVDPRSNGRLTNLRITSPSYWRLAGLAIDIKPADRR